MRTPYFDMLTVFFPAWNEEENIERSVDAVSEVADHLVDLGAITSYEVLIVDDASTDRTGEICDRLASENPDVRVVHHERNRKLGGALRTGFENAKGEIVLYTDADLPIDFYEAVKSVRLMHTHDADIVSAYRLGRREEGARRAVLSGIYNLMVRALFGLRVRDVNFAFKLVNRRVLDRVPLASEGSFIDAELLIRAQHEGFRILQFGTEYYPRTRGSSTLSSAAVIMKLLDEMWSFRRQLQEET